MKIAIQGHPTRGKEVIQILESLGGKNISNHDGKDKYAYYISSIDRCIYKTSLLLSEYKHYTLEEFEKEFPFKIGDKVKHITSIGTIKEYCYINNEPAYKVESMELGIIATIPAKLLEPYKEMDVRRVTVTLDKAKEWYKKGGTLKEIALQAYSEKELTKVDLPKTWEEFYEQYEFKPVLNLCLSAVSNNFSMKYVNKFEAFVKLQYLRDCWRQGWTYTPEQTGYSIKFINGKLGVHAYGSREFLSFPTKEMAEVFLKCFKNLIEKAGDLI